MKSFRHAQIEHLGNVFSIEQDIQGLAGETRSLTAFTTNKCRRKKAHFQLDRARALALRTAALFAVERKPAGGVSPQPRLRHLGVQEPDLIEKTNVGRRSRPRSPANR